jgi:pyruvate kinase
MSFEIKAHVIICFTLTGEIARLVAKYRPRAPIIAIRYYYIYILVLKIKQLKV